MVKYTQDPLSSLFAALADPTRRQILARLAVSDTTVGELAEPLAMSGPAVTKHLRVLEKVGLLVKEKEGRVRRCRLDASPLKDASDWVGAYRVFWEKQMDGLAAFLEAIEKEEEDDSQDGRGNIQVRDRPGDQSAGA